MRKHLIGLLAALALGGASAQDLTYSQQKAYELATVMDGVIVDCGGLYTDYFGCLDFPRADVDLVRSWVGLYVDDLNWEPVGPWVMGVDNSLEREFQTDIGRIEVNIQSYAEYDRSLDGAWVFVSHPVDWRRILGYCERNPDHVDCP